MSTHQLETVEERTSQDKEESHENRGAHELEMTKGGESVHGKKATK